MQELSRLTGLVSGHWGTKGQVLWLGWFGWCGFMGTLCTIGGGDAKYWEVYTKCNRKKGENAK